MLRRLALGLLVTAVACSSGGGGSANKTSTTRAQSSTTEPPIRIQLTSSAFKDGGDIPAQYTCDGANQSPPLSWDVAPEVASVAIRLQDIDTPQKFIHWIVYDIKPTTESLAAGEVPAGAKQTANSFGKQGYGGPCPPAGQRHRYVFTIISLATELNVSESVSPSDLWATLERSQVISRGELTGTYQRPSS